MLFNTQLDGTLWCALVVAGSLLACDGKDKGAVADDSSGTDSALDSGANTDTDSDTAQVQDTGVEPTTDAPGACVRHVRLDSVSGADGLAWATALGSVSAAITAAAEAVLQGAAHCEVWVQGGVYYIYQTAATDTVQLAAKVDVYGGFAGNELTRDARDVAAHPTVLSGQKTADDFQTLVLHVVKGANDALLDGFVVMSGNADVGDQDPTNNDNYGGGMLNVSVAPTVRHTSFAENDAMWEGAIANLSGADAIFESCTVSDSMISGMYNSESSPTVRSSIFAGNRWSAMINNGKRARPVVEASVFAGNNYYAVENDFGAVVTIKGCTFAGNYYAPPFISGGAIYNVGGAALVTDSIFWNETGTEIVCDDLDGGKATVATSTVRGGFAGQGNLATDPMFEGFPQVKGLQWKTVAFEPSRGVTVLTASETLAASAGMFVQPNTAAGEDVAGPAWVPVASAAGAAVTVQGDVSWFVKAGDPFALYDLHLAAGSPCVDKGSAKTSPAADVSGKARGQSPDMGAYER